MPWKGGGLSRITGAIDYNRFAPSGQNGQRGFIKDSQILEAAAARGEIPESNEGGGVGKQFTVCRRSGQSAPAGRTSRYQSNRLDTDSSAAVRPIASPISVAMD